jgi:hypothetical protein
MTVRILQVSGVLALVGAVAVSALCVLNGWRGDSHIAGIAAPSAIERFKQAGGSNDRSRSAQLSPLVRQAQIFAAYLNPPPASKRKPSSRPIEKEAVVAQTPEVKPANPSAKFKLHGISYRPSRPEDSMALVWEPGTGHRWVKEGAQLGHITIVEINGDSVLCTDGTNTRAMALDLNQTGAVFADGRKKRTVRKQSNGSEHAVAHWSPVRRIRQIPPARAARRGVILSDGDMGTP